MPVPGVVPPAAGVGAADMNAAVSAEDVLVAVPLAPDVAPVAAVVAGVSIVVTLSDGKAAVASAVPLPVPVLGEFRGHHTQFPTPRL